MKETQFLQYIIENIVDTPSDINIDSVDDELGTLITLKVHPNDMGIVIGKKGSTITALRTIVRLKGMKIGKKLTLKVVENND